MSKTVDESGRATPPLTRDQLVLRDNQKASEPVPDRVRERWARRSLALSSLDPARKVEVRWEAGAYEHGVEAALPAHVIEGQPGRSAQRVAIAEVARVAHRAAEPAGFRPAWVDHVYHPKLASAVRVAPSLRRRSGKRITPLYGVFGADDRRTYYPAGYPWHCIGRLFTWDDASKSQWSQWGTGVLIGRRHVLTAGHLVPWDSPHWKMKFVPGYYDGSSVVGPGVSSYVSDAHGWDTGLEVAAHDMAVLRLYDDLGSDLGYFGAKTYDHDWNGSPYWELLGYPSDVQPPSAGGHQSPVTGGERPKYQIDIPVLDCDDDGTAAELEHHGDITGGNSGSPLFAFWSDGYPYVVGTISGGERFWGPGSEDNNIAAGGAAMVDLIRWAREFWP